jgi:hypothetical protein
VKKAAVLTLSVVTILASVIAVFAQAPTPGQGTSYGAVQNVGCTGNARFVQEFYDENGNVDAYREKADVACGDTMGLTTNQTADAPLDMELPPGWAGSSVVSSDQEAAAVVLIQWTGGGIGSDGVTTADYVGELNPGDDVFCPSVGKRDNEDSTIVIMNASDSPVTDVSISFKDRNGVDAGTEMTGITIAARAQATFNLYDAAFALPANFLGAARVQSAGGTPLAVVAYTHWGSAGGAYGTFAYNCAPTAAAATTLYAPKVQRRKPTWNSSQWFDATGIIVVNTEVTPAGVTVNFYDRDGNFSGSFDDTIPAYSARGYNTRYYGNADHAVIDALIGTGTAADPIWQGSAVVTSNTGEKIVGVVKQGYDTDLWAGGYNMLSDADAAQTWSFPLVYRRGFNKPWTDYVGFVCQNVSSSDIAPEVTYVDRRATAPKCTATTTSCSFTDANPFGQYVSHGYNTRYGGAQAASWFGLTSGGGAGTGNTLHDNFIGAASASISSGSMVCIQETWAEEVYADGWVNGGDANLNNAYGQ